MFASSKYIAGMGFFSQLTDFFFFSFFVLNDFVPGHNPIINFTSFPWFSLVGYFFAAPPESKSLLLLPQQYSVEQLM